MKLLKPILLLALIYALLGGALLWAERLMFGDEGLQQAFPIACLAVFFFGLTLAELYISRQLRKSGDAAGLNRFLLLMKGIRLIMSALIFAIYAVAIKRGLVPFAVNVLVFYIATMLFTTIYYVREEKRKPKISNETH